MRWTMKIKFELNVAELLVVLSALTEFALHPDHEKVKELAEKIRLDIRKAASKAFREEKRNESNSKCER